MQESGEASVGRQRSGTIKRSLWWWVDGRKRRNRGRVVSPGVNAMHAMYAMHANATTPIGLSGDGR